MVETWMKAHSWWGQQGSVMAVSEDLVDQTASQECKGSSKSKNLYTMSHFCHHFDHSCILLFTATAIGAQFVFINKGSRTRSSAQEPMQTTYILEIGPMETLLRPARLFFRAWESLHERSKVYIWKLGRRIARSLELPFVGGRTIRPNVHFR